MEIVSVVVSVSVAVFGVTVRRGFLATQASAEAILVAFFRENRRMSTTPSLLVSRTGTGVSSPSVRDRRRIFLTHHGIPKGQLNAPRH